MTSLSYRAVTAILHALDVPQRTIRDMAADRTHVSGPPLGLRNIDRFEHDGHPVYRFVPAGGAPRGRVLHFHGGAFVYGLLGPHYRFAQRLARLANVEVWLPEYPLPPEVHAEAVAAWTDGLTERAMAEGPLVLMGDSAGGGLALGAAQRWQADGRNLPRALILMSPWTDLTCETPVPEDADEPLIALSSGLKAARRYAGGLDLADPIVSPLNGQLGGLPPVTLIGGAKDVLRPDTHRLRDALAAAGTEVRFIEEAELGHWWMYYPVPEAKRTMAEIAAVVRGALA